MTKKKPRPYDPCTEQPSTIKELTTWAAYAQAFMRPTNHNLPAFVFLDLNRPENSALIHYCCTTYNVRDMGLEEIRKLREMYMGITKKTYPQADAATLVEVAEALKSRPFPILDETDLTILRTLAERKTAMHQSDIEAADVSRRTISDRMPGLIRQGLVEKHGERGGYAITQYGLDAIAACATRH